jgi:hypothetical protein
MLEYGLGLRRDLARVIRRRRPDAARWLLVGGDPRPTHGVDITGEPLERGIASLEAHGQYLAAIQAEPGTA